MPGKENMESIIFRHLNKETSVREETELEAWLNDSEQNRLEFNELKAVWEESAKLMNLQQFDTEAAWKAVSAKISSAASEADTTKKYLFPAFLKIAAMTILLAGVASLIYYFIISKNPVPVKIIATTSNRKIILPDGTSVLLREGSQIQYPKDYGITNRKIELSGEAYLAVVHQPHMPFQIHTQRTIIRDLGTSLLVISTPMKEKVFVTQGEVKIEVNTDTSNAIIVRAGQFTTLIGKLFEKDSIQDENYLSWQTGLLKFDHATLRKMVADLNEYFHTTIVMSNSLAAQSDTIYVNFQFNKNSLEQVLEEIRLTTGLMVEHGKDSIVLHEK